VCVGEDVRVNLRYLVCACECVCILVFVIVFPCVNDVLCG